MGVWKRAWGAHWFHFQGPRMKDKELGDRILEGLIPRVSGMVLGRVLASYLSQWATCFGIIKEAG